MGAELYLLESGDYVYAVISDGDDEYNIRSIKEFTVTGPRTRIEFSVPPKKLSYLQVRKKATK